MPDRTGGIARTSPLRRNPLYSSGPTKPRKAPRSAEEREAKRLVRERSNGWCELQLSCCVGRAYDFSHRIAVGRGGRWEASNGLDACRWCHTAITNTNGHRAEYERLGYIVQTGADTTQVAVLIAGRFVLLADDGSTQDYQDQQKGA